MVYVALSETTLGDGSGTTIPLEDSPRTVPLVIGNSYALSCSGTWYRERLIMLEPCMTGEGYSGACTVFDGVEAVLKLLLLNENQTGQYMCRNSLGEEFIINITTGETCFSAHAHF